MQPMKEMIEWYLEIPSAGPGEGTAWNLRYDTPWPHWMPDWLVLIVVLLAVGVVVGIYLRDAKSASPLMRIGFISLRLSLLLVLLVFLSGVILRIDRMGLSTVVVLIDDSASMKFEDQYSEEKIADVAGKLISRGELTDVTRLNLVKALLTNERGIFLQKLLRNHKLRVYRFSETVVPVDGEFIEGDDLERLTQQLLEVSPQGSQTRPGPAVRKVLDDLRGTRPSAVVVFTDGITSTTDADKLSSVAELARDTLIPIYTVGIGSEDPIRDLHLYDMHADEVAFVDEPILFSAQIKGYELEGRTVSFSLKEKGTKEPLAVQDVELNGDGLPVKVEIAYSPSRAGEFDYILEVEPLSRETNRDNNSDLRHVSVRDEKIRVLLADSYRRWEFGYLKSLLERDGTIELHTILQDADPEYAFQDETARPINGRFPVSYEALAQYAVVILGDLDPADFSFGILQNIKRYVEEAGGGLIMIAGMEHNPISYRGTPLEPLLPFEIDSVRIPSPEVSIDESYQPALTLEGQQGTPIFQFAENPRDNLTVWNQLPDFTWMVEAAEMKPGAVVFVEHPTRGGTDHNFPVIAMQRFGGGKVLFHATDELWRWRFRQGDRYFGRYWIQAIRYLGRSRLLGTDGTAELMTDRLVYQRGESVRLRLRFLNEKLAPLEGGGVSVMIERQGGGNQRIELNRLTNETAVFEGNFSRAAEGAYHAFVVEPSFSNAAPSADFRVELPYQELQKRSLDSQELTRTARISRGRSYTLATVDRLPDQLPAGQPVPLESGSPIPLWNRWELMLLFGLLLMSEWLLRKRCRLV